MLNVTEYVFNGTDTVKLGIKDVIYNPPATIVLWEMVQRQYRNVTKKINLIN